MQGKAGHIKSGVEGETMSQLYFLDKSFPERPSTYLFIYNMFQLPHSTRPLRQFTMYLQIIIKPYKAPIKQKC